MSRQKCDQIKGYLSVKEFENCESIHSLIFVEN